MIIETTNEAKQIKSITEYWFKTETENSSHKKPYLRKVFQAPCE